MARLKLVTNAPQFQHSATQNKLGVSAEQSRLNSPSSACLDDVTSSERTVLKAWTEELNLPAKSEIMALRRCPSRMNDYQ